MNKWKKEEAKNNEEKAKRTNEGKLEKKFFNQWEKRRINVKTKKVKKKTEKLQFVKVPLKKVWHWYVCGGLVVSVLESRAEGYFIEFS